MGTGYDNPQKHAPEGAHMIPIAHQPHPHGGSRRGWDRIDRLYVAIEETEEEKGRSLLVLDVGSSLWWLLHIGETNTENFWILIMEDNLDSILYILLYSVQGIF